MNYFSRWIANLGVVPLLLFAAFLFFPAFTFLAALLFLVTRVLETIYPLQFSTSAVLFSIREMVLPTQSSAVKIFLLISVSCAANYVDAEVQDIEKTTIILSKGQHHEIQLDKISHYSITNKDTLGHKFAPSEKKLYLKGKKLGFAEVIIWHGPKSKKVFKVYVLQKNRHLKIIQLGEIFEQMGLKIKLVGPILELKGIVSDYPIYKKIKQITDKNNEQIISKVSLSKNLKSFILSETYKEFLKRYVDSIDCQIRYINIECSYSNHVNIKAAEKLKKKYFIDFTNLGIENKNSNLRIHFDIKKVIINTSKNVDPGLDEYKGQLQSLINKDFMTPLYNNKFNFKGLEGHLMTIAKPSILVIPGEESKLLLGSEVPYDLGEEKGTGFKFAGLKIITKALPRGRNYLCDFSISLSKPRAGGDSSFEENQQSSKVILAPGETANVFSIDITNSISNKEMTPYISKIPLLGHLFTSHNNGNSIQKVIAYVRIERIDSN